MESLLRVAVVCGNDTTAVFLEGLLILRNAYEKVKVFEITALWKLRGNVYDQFVLKRFFSCVNIPDKFLA